MTTVYTRQTTANNATNLNAILTMAQFDNNLLALNAGKLDNDSNRSIVKPSLVLDFSKKLLDPRVTFSRASTAPYYDGKTSVLAEQNTTLNSAGLTGQLALSLGSATISYNSTTAPDGTTTATSIVPTNGATNAVYYIGNGPTPATNSYTVSLYVKANGMNYIAIGTNNNAVVIEANLSTGLVISGSGFVISAGNGWYRVVATISFYTNGTYYLQVRDTAGTITLSTANGTNGIYVWGAQSEQRSSATAYNATTTALTNYIPQLLTAPINSPRFDFNPTTGESLGLLIEQSSTNLLTYSQDFSNAAWTKTRSSVTTSANIAPDGTQTAQVLYEDTSNNSHLTYEAYTITAGNPYIFSMYAKAWTRTQLGITFDNVSWSFDLSAGTILSGSAGTITPVGNGWYRITCYRASITTASSFVFIIINNAGAGSYQGNGYSGIYIWGAQLEALAFPTSYIPTTSAQVTRASDKAVILNVSGIYNPTQGTILVQGSQNSTFGQNYPLASFSDGTLTNKLYTELYGAITYGIAGNSATLTGQSVGAIKTPFKMALAAQTNDAQLCTNGTLNQSSSSLTMPPNISELDIGCFINFGSQIRTYNGCISKIAYYPIRVTNAQLQALTGS
jgi:hypothetical protein